MTKKHEQRRIPVMHPIYLDTPMLLSFIATIEDGFSTSAEITEAQKGSVNSEGSGEGGAGTGEIVSALGLKLDASGKYMRKSGNDRSAEQRFKKEHTSASLFNRLYGRLHDSDFITKVDELDTLRSVQVGDIVEVSGIISENPAEQILRTMDRFIPFVSKFATDEGGSEQPKLNRNQLRSLSQEQREALEKQANELANKRGEIQKMEALVDALRKDLNESPIVDLILKRDGLSAMLTASREFFSQESSAMLVGGTFYVIGKVTGVNDDPDSDTRIMRRGAVAGAAPVMDGFAQMGEFVGTMLELPSVESAVHGRCMQIIPLAIYI